ncbi:peroxiredoxin [Salinibaculum rarum]|jgi:peroxiredoxin Q/BCP|uniref:peroxiredoxin n=1 Tax=Salinibaculum rarum TaxID=3058903 RepID=UPI00265FBC9B|nr:peroxiredoxin [Salinibaculum sp. KK48]
MVLDTGASVPAVSATNQNGDRITVDFVAPTVLFFYPRDGTPGCTTEASQFQAELETYREAGIEVYGVSTDDADAHREFADSEGLEFDLLADPDERIADAFGVPVSDGAAERTTFVCAKRQVCGLYEGVHPDGHARNVLKDILDVGLASLE